MEILGQGFDHVEFVVHDPKNMGAVFTRMGFEKVGQRVLSQEDTQSVVYAQGLVRLILTSPLNASNSGSRSESLSFLRKHAEGVCVLALEVRDATRAFEEAVQKGARPARKPTVFQSPEGVVVRSEIWTPGDVRYAFIERKLSGAKNSPALFDEGLVVSRMESPSPLGIQSIDHLTNNVGMGQMKDWVAFYERIFGFGVTRHFDIRTQRTGLISDVVESADHRVKVPINEPTEAASQIQEFVDRMKGTGVQHLALITSDIQQTLKSMRRQKFEFLSVPHTYYEAVPTRVLGVTENLEDLEALGILLDGEGEGYLLQIFTQEVLGPFFFELIQRKGNQGFGEGNFRALFEAIERDQVRRGVLSAGAPA